jgi:SAM-dependent methyltransferase
VAAETTCPVCERSAMVRVADYAHCPSCDYWSSSLPHDVARTDAPAAEYELVSYEHTRRANYTTILELLDARHPRGSRLLEIGCADGLFLDMAHDRSGYEAIGIEPNAKMIAGNPRGRDIHVGFFPDVLAGSELVFDIIALNCVFEHVPDLEGMIASFKRYLAPGGSVMLNVPVSSGFMFKLSRALYAVGVRYPFDRIWQKGFVSPHLHFFSTDNISRLLARNGLQLVASAPLAVQPGWYPRPAEHRSEHPRGAAVVGARLPLRLLPGVAGDPGRAGVRVRARTGVTITP